MRGLPWRLLESQTAIQPVVVGANAAAVDLAERAVAARLLGPGDPPADRAEGNGAAADHAHRRALARRRRCARRRARRARARGRVGKPAMSGTLHVESLGDGPPLVLLHGWAMHSGIWGPLVPRLAKRNRVHAVDLPGHGHSALAAPFTLEGAVAAVSATFAGRAPPARRARLVARRARRDALGTKRAGEGRAAGARLDLAPLRRGRRLAARGARARRSHGSATSCTSPGSSRSSASWRFRCTAASTGGRRSRHCAQQVFARGEPSPKAPLRRARRDRQSDLRAEVDEIAQPALVVSGERDTLALPAAGRWLALHLRDARFALIAGASHVPFPLARRGVRRGARRIPRWPLTPRGTRTRPRPSGGRCAAISRAPPRPTTARRSCRRRSAGGWPSGSTSSSSHPRRSSTRAAAPATRRPNSPSGIRPRGTSRSTSRCRCSRGAREGRSLPLGARAGLRDVHRRTRRRRPAPLRLRRRRGDAVRGGDVRPRLEQPRAAMGERPAGALARDQPRARRGRPRDVLDVRAGHAEGAARARSPTSTVTRMSAASPTCTTSATCWSARASPIR